MSVIKVTGSNGRTYQILGGTHTPNGRVYGYVGDLYLRDNGGNGEFWQKVTGDNTQSGWTQITAGGFTVGGQYLNDAAAATGGIAIGAYYINSATGAISQRLT